jgi:putative copper resistance protein D
MEPDQEAALPSMSGMPMVNFTLHNAMTRWNLSVFPLCVLGALVICGVAYLRADWKLASRGRRWHQARTVSFFAGLVATGLAFASPVAVFAGTYFQAHIVQHLLLMVTAPPLLALGAPSTLFLQTASRKAKARWLQVLRSTPFAVVSHPITVFILYYGVMFLFFLTSLINLAMHHMDLMDAINVLFLFGGTLFWWPMVGVDPIIHWKMGYGARLINILIGGGVEAFLGVAILFDAHPVATMYTLSSTHAGGGLLWSSTELATVAAFLPIYLQWMHSEDRVAARYDLNVDRAIAERSDEAWDRQNAGPRSAWEAEWIARTGSAPTFDTSKPPGDSGDDGRSFPAVDLGAH